MMAEENEGEHDTVPLLYEGVLKVMVSKEERRVFCV